MDDQMMTGYAGLFAGGDMVPYDRCTGCRICFEQCPCWAIQMIPEPLHG